MPIIVESGRWVYGHLTLFSSVCVFKAFVIEYFILAQEKSRQDNFLILGEGLFCVCILFVVVCVLQFFALEPISHRINYGLSDFNWLTEKGTLLIYWIWYQEQIGSRYCDSWRWTHRRKISKILYRIYPLRHCNIFSTSLPVRLLFT